MAAGFGLWMVWERRVPVGRWNVPTRIVGVMGLGVGLAAYVKGRQHLPVQFRSIWAVAEYRARYFRQSGSNMGIDFRNLSKPVLAVRYLESLLGNTIGPLPTQIDTSISMAFALEALTLGACA